MLTKLTVRNFKRFEDVEIELGNPVVFIGPNNSGKTSAMQALALWHTGLRIWNARRAGEAAAEKRPGMTVMTVNRPVRPVSSSPPKKRRGVTVNRRDAIAVPVPRAALLWRGLRTRDTTRKADGGQSTKHVRIEIVVEGVSEGRAWTCGLEFDYANPESFYCRPLRTEAGHMPVPDAAGAVRLAFLPPMSGLAATETRIDEGAVDVRIGEGRTAEVLRNLCYRIHEETPELWPDLARRIESLFGATLEAPKYVHARGEIEMAYTEGGIRLDLSSSGRGLQQILLMMAYMYVNPGSVFLLDEPDAHLETLRQREIYNLLAETASQKGGQIVAASHSEVVLNEAAGKDLVVAFVGAPHRIDGQAGQLHKALAEIGFDQYAQAEQNGWVLYLEGSTDLDILRAFARRLGHAAAERLLERPFVHYVGNQTRAAERHYFGLREALPGLKGVALFDRIGADPVGGPLVRLVWRKREIENYLCSEETLEAWARSGAEGPAPLFARADADRRADAMREAVSEVAGAMETLGKGSPWDGGAKASDDFLTPLFAAYFRKLGLPDLMAKKDFHELAQFVPEAGIDPEVGEKLDAIARAAGAAEPAA